MFDFIDRLKNELMLDVRTKKGCHDQMFFIINSQNAFELIYYLPLFIKRWNIKASTNEIRNTISDEAWYKQPVTVFYVNYMKENNIEIELKGIGQYSDKISYIKSGWMIQSDGSISLNTPFLVL